MVILIFNSYVSLPEGNQPLELPYPVSSNMAGLFWKSPRIPEKWRFSMFAGRIIEPNEPCLIAGGQDGPLYNINNYDWEDAPPKDVFQ